jgi:transposase
MGMTLKHAAEYVRTSKAPKAFFRFIDQIRRIISFTQERANRLRRFIVITRAYRNGDQVRDIEERFGCSRQTVLRYARLAGLAKRPKHFPQDIRAAVIADYKEMNGNRPRFSVTELAALHDVSPAYVSKIAREEGISRYAPRPKRRRRSPARPRGHAALRGSIRD